MTTRIQIFYPAVQAVIGDTKAVKVKGRTVAECLTDLVRQFPATAKWLFDDKGALLDQVFVFINAESAQKAALSTRLHSGDELILAVMIIGGGTAN